jgi:hypothetical protein
MVFGLRRATNNSTGGRALPSSDVARIHATFLVIVVAWVWLCVAIRTRLPYFLTTEDTNRPYFGLAFFGILGLFLLEGLEQRYLRPRTEPGDLPQA